MATPRVFLSWNTHPASHASPSRRSVGCDRYTSAIPFNVIKNPAFAKFCDMVATYGVGYKPPSCHDIRDKLLKRAVEKIDLMLQEFRDEWKRIGCTIMSDGWTNKKKAFNL